MANKRFWLGMLVMAPAFGMTVIGCGDIDLIGGSQEPVYFSLYKDDIEAVGTVEIRFRTNKLYSDDITDWNLIDVNNDFHVTINGSPKRVTGLGIIYGTNLNIGIEGHYPINSEYIVKVVYTANPARKIYFNYETGELLKSFTIEKKD